MVFSKEKVIPKGPSHVAIIMDGNRRWAKKRLLPAAYGHREGAERLDEILRVASEIGVKFLTVFVFSTENWDRPKAEVAGIMSLLERYLLSKKDEMKKEGVRLELIGDISLCPEKVQKAFTIAQKETKKGDKITLVLAINYGAKDEIRRTFLKILDDCDKGKIKKEMISEELISKYLDTANIPNPDLLIRTSGEKRISNFLLWQLSYAELYLSPVLWPDFGKKEFLEAVVDFNKRERRGGS